MPKVRLVGLVLMVTSVFLGLAAATTQTSHVKFGVGAADQGEASSVSATTADSAGAKQPQNLTQLKDGEEGAEVGMQSEQSISEQPVHGAREVPVLWPLAASTAVGMLLWFGPAGASELRAGSRKSPRRRKKRRRNRHASKK